MKLWVIGGNLLRPVDNRGRGEMSRYLVVLDGVNSRIAEDTQVEKHRQVLQFAMPFGNLLCRSLEAEDPIDRHLTKCPFASWPRR